MTGQPTKGSTMQLKSKIRGGAAALALTTTLVGTAAGPASALVANPGAQSGCSPQNVCLYTGTWKPGTTPSGAHTDYSYYGYDNFSNVVGKHFLYNKQTGGAKVYPCLGYGGKNCSTITFTYPDGSSSHYLKAGFYTVLDFTPINSIRLTP